jgi:hypothetical protein
VLATRDTGAFAFLLTATPEPAADVPAVAGTAAPVFDFSERADRRRPKATLPDWVSLALAIILPPLGLLVSIGVRIWSSRSNGWTTRVVRAATAISVVLSIALGVAVVVVGALEAEAEEKALIAAEAQPLCEALDTTPGVLESPAFGWPTARVAIPQTVEAMKVYRAQWVALADVAPTPIAAGVRSVAGTAQSIITSVESTQVLDRQRNLDQMTAVATSSGLTAWYGAYCG